MKLVKIEVGAYFQDQLRVVDYPKLGLAEPGWTTVGSGSEYLAIELGQENPRRYFVAAGGWDFNGLWPLESPRIALIALSGAANVVAQDSIESIDSVYGGFQQIQVTPGFLVLWNFGEAVLVLKNGVVRRVSGDLHEIQEVVIEGNSITLRSYEPGPMIRKTHAVYLDEPKVSDKQ